MSGAELTDFGSGQVTGINESGVDCSDIRVESSSDNKGVCVPPVIESVPNLVFEPVEESISIFSDTVVGGEVGECNGGVVNLDVGQCLEQGLSSIQAVGEEFGTGFQGSELAEMGNAAANYFSSQNQENGVDAGSNVEEQLPDSRVESENCEQMGEGKTGVSLVDQKIPGNSVGEVETLGGASQLDDRCEAGKDGDGGSNGNNEETHGESLNPQKSENKTLEPVEVASWELICEVAKQSEETASLELDENEAMPEEDLKINKEGTFLSGDQSEQKELAAFEAEQDDSKNAQRVLDKSHLGVGKSFGGIEEDKSAACDVKPIHQLPGPPLSLVNDNARVVVLGLPPKDGTEKPIRLRTPAKEASDKRRSGRRPRKASASPERTSHQTSAQSKRVLRSRAQDNPVAVEPSTNLENTKGCSAGRRGRKKKEMKERTRDEFLKMKNHLKYLLNRISYEQNLLDAYSNEGWRGQSLEKLRPEKELQRAKADINRSKLKIRALFQQLDSISSEGKFPESLYDSDGLIDSEDIFCAKCGSKDLPPGNDIILCDGICERGFHQYCLVPPLRTEEIPPGDEGWLCPACDCRVDCVDLLNDSHGTKLSIEDSWEKVFPEAVVATAGHEQDDLMGLPSDDSEDNDYNPEGLEDDAKVEGREASSDESDSDGSESDESDSSDFSSASEDLGAVRGDEQFLGLPSDDSEDDDFDPAAPSVGDDNCETSSSDFSSASEDLGATVGDDEMPDNEPSVPADLDVDLGDLQPHSARRDVKRLDYKKLYDEEYGNAVSSDDEEWTDNAATRRRKIVADKNVLASTNGDVTASAGSACPAVSPGRRGQPKRNCQAAASPSAELEKTPLETSKSGTSRKRPPYNKLGELVTQRLLESFKENQYPDRATKEKLAEELGLTPLRVDKWFGNARWSLHHHPSRMEASIARVVPNSSAPRMADCNGAESSSAKNDTSTLQGGTVDASKLDIGGSGGGMSTRSRKRKMKSDDEPVLQTSELNTPSKSTPAHASPAPVGTDTANKDTEASPLPAPETQHARMKRKTRSSGL